MGCKFKDYLISDSNHYLTIDQSLNLDEVFFSYSQDHNTSGKQLSEVCVTHDLKVLNGRTVGDMTGKITCFKYNGFSVVDYIVVQTDIIERVQYFRVNPLIPWSDHCQITAIFNIQPRSKQESQPVKGKIVTPNFKRNEDNLISDSNHYLPIDQSLNLDEVSFRNSQHHNTSGKQLSEVCFTHDLKVLNGRTNGDMTGKITCFKYNGFSVVDYIVVQTDIIERVQYFRVNPLIPWSDHCQITAIFNIQPRSKQESQPVKGKIVIPNFKRNEDNHGKVNAFMRTRDFIRSLEMAKAKISTTTLVDEDSQETANVVINVSEKCLHLSKTKKYRKTKRNTLIKNVIY